MPMSDFFRNGLLNQTFRGTAFTFPANLWWALLTSMPDTDATGANITEPATANNYGRVQLNPSTTNYNLAAAGATWNLNAVTFNAPNNPWGNVVGVALTDASANGNLYYYGPLDPPQPIAGGAAPPTFSASQLQIIIGGC